MDRLRQLLAGDAAVHEAHRDEALIRTIAERVEAFYGELERRMTMVMVA
ncbi:hypothetical protein [Halomonas caseinilytica]|nr:hypothetical protein [Halomonas caseinilytica]